MERRGTATRTAGPAEKAGALHVEIVANDAGPGVVAHLTWTDDQDKTAERRLEAPDCVAAVNALALIAALALVRGNTASGAAPPTPSTASPPPAPPPPPTPSPSPSASPAAALAPAPAHATTTNSDSRGDSLLAKPSPGTADSPPTVSFSGTADAFVSLGTAPDAAFGVLALAGIALARRAPFGPILLRAGIDAIPARSYSVAGALASFETWSAVGEVCPLSLHVGSHALISPCVLGEFGVVDASGPGGENALTRPWAAAGLEARLAIQLVGPLFFDASIDGMAAIDRNRFHVGDTLVYETPSAMGRLAVGLGWLIP